MSLKPRDRWALERAVELARRGVGDVEPNPPVGAVLFDATRVLGEGWHHAYGEVHAETEALRGWPAVPDTVSLAVTLEPCSSIGKQPACTEALLRHGVRRVVVGATDPDPRHEGRGLQWLREHGIETILAPPGTVTEELLEEFQRCLRLRRPYLILKWATTLDGSFRRSHSRWVSGEEARSKVHHLRGRVDGILVGSGTVLADDPALTARPAGPLLARRIVLDARGRMPRTCRLLHEPGGEVVWVTAREVSADLPGVRRVDLEHPHELAAEVLPALYELGVRRMLVEAGPTLTGALLDAQVVDRAWVFVAPHLERDAALRLSRACGDVGADARLEKLEICGGDAWFRLKFCSR